MSRATGFTKNTCVICNHTYKIPHNLTKVDRSKSITCSKTCQHEWQRSHPNKTVYKNGHKGMVGKNNPMWTNGSSAKEKRWREAIFNRDNFTCYSCGERGKYLNAHHIKERSLNPELKFNLTNGVTLCRKCHVNLHKQKGWINQWPTCARLAGLL